MAALTILLLYSYYTLAPLRHAALPLYTSTPAYSIPPHTSSSCFTFDPRPNSTTPLTAAQFTAEAAVDSVVDGNVMAGQVNQFEGFTYQEDAPGLTR